MVLLSLLNWSFHGNLWVPPPRNKAPIKERWCFTNPLIKALFPRRVALGEVPWDSHNWKLCYQTINTQNWILWPSQFESRVVTNNPQKQTQWTCKNIEVSEKRRKKTMFSQTFQFSGSNRFQPLVLWGCNQMQPTEGMKNRLQGWAKRGIWTNRSQGFRSLTDSAVFLWPRLLTHKEDFILVIVFI